MTILQKFYQVRNRILKETIQLPVFKVPSELAYIAALKEYSSKLPVLSPQDSIICDTIRREGIFVTSLKALAIPSNHYLLTQPTNYYQQYLQLSLKINMNLLSMPVPLKLWTTQRFFSGGLKKGYLIL